MLAAARRAPTEGPVGGATSLAGPTAIEKIKYS
jgi:hypothetical protein